MPIKTRFIFIISPYFLFPHFNKVSIMKKLTIDPRLSLGTIKSIKHLEIFTLVIYYQKTFMEKPELEHPQVVGFVMAQPIFIH